MITLVRHGQTEGYDPDVGFPLIDGQGDPKLTELGKRQAQAVGDRLRSEAIDAVYVSSLTRTHQTAAPLASALGIDPVVEADLREVNLGDWEGGLFRKYSEEGTHPAILAMRKNLDWGEVPGAESNAELTARCVGGIERVHAACRGQHVVCFVHGGVVAALLSHAAKGHLFAFMGSDNAAIHRMAINDERTFIYGFNDVTHLEQNDLRSPVAQAEPKV